MTGAAGTFALYEYEGYNYNYAEGEYTEIPFRWNDRSRTLTIGARSGQYKGMLQKRRFRVVIGAKGLDDATATAVTIDYDGQEVSRRIS